jgi:hypothetical protein
MQMTFRNAYNFEDAGEGSSVGMDGMVLEISINGGPFVDVIDAGGSFVTGGYNKRISTSFGSPIAGRMAWSGLSAGTESLPAYITTTVDLPTSAFGQFVQLRWLVASDENSVAAGEAGARIDTVLGSSCAPTAAEARISGRVMTRDGRTIPNADVTLTDSTGSVRRVRTGSFGYYGFDVQAGATVVLAARARNYTFEAQVLVVTDNLVDMDLISRE